MRELDFLPDPMVHVHATGVLEAGFAWGGHVDFLQVTCGWNKKLGALVGCRTGLILGAVSIIRVL